jgi:hypothetical protein
MNHQPLVSDNRSAPPHVGPLEYLTAGVLCLVIVLLCWMVLVAYLPQQVRLVPLEWEVAAVVSVLSAALALTSIVALRHTRSVEH